MSYVSKKEQATSNNAVYLAETRYLGQHGGKNEMIFFLMKEIYNEQL